MESTSTLPELTSAATSSRLVGLPLTESARVLLLVLGWLAWVSGVFGNILIIVTLLSQPTLRCHIYNIYIGNLAVADLIVVCYCMLFWLLDLSLGYYPAANKAHCYANGFVLSMCFMTSIYTLLLISFNRYLSVCKPTIYDRIFSRTNTIALCAAMWIVSIIIGVLPFFNVGKSSYVYSTRARICSFNGSNPTNLMNVITVMNLTAPTIIIGFFSVAIFRFWRSSQQRIGQWTSNRPQPGTEGQARPSVPRARVLSSSNLALIRSLFLVFFLLIVLYLPLAIGLSAKENWSSDTYLFLVLLLFLNHCINWLVYGALNKNFRNGYRRLILVRCLGLRWAAAAGDNELTMNTIT